MSKIDPHRMTIPTAAKKEVQRVMRDGWELSMGGSHYQLRRPDTIGGGRIIMSTSSRSDCAKRVIRDIRKLERS